ncbi:arginyltransferase [Pseudomaricurvus alkylphenolicus]|jgi:arginine-tRNA-protein transferase|uniref:arginyltransferase n=1 Tax=Pseudomaricurvus alkylphenolicus TaxID=1306991 RepID=UPI00141E3D1C|nr:arginyltransferase [Pseudomaricurvus alkylphenolicus]NIB41172.1 arginyltransferase [Pseudomaricurvus alkylphenolicus]
MTDLGTIRLFATHPHACSYLPEEEATTVFVDPTYPVEKNLYSQLSESGFRRSGSHLYRPHCSHCKACVPARIPVSAFQMNRQQRRCWKRNQDLDIRQVEQIDTETHYQLYARYIELRHNDGDMYPPSPEQYRSFLTSEWGVTEYLEFWLEERLLGVAVCDRMTNGYSAVYTFFEPAEHRRSLGAFAILYQIELAKAAHLPSVYLGYWIKQCPKMSYKTNYRPLELYIDNRWVRIN